MGNIEYKPNKLSEENKFFAKRVQKWVLHPEKDKALTEEVKAGKWPELKVFLRDSKLD